MKRFKKCLGCGKVKPLSKFHKNISVLDGRRPRCKECSSTKKILSEIECKYCSSIFTPSSSHNKYCSKRCKILVQMEKRSKKPKTKTCLFCSKEFKPYSSMDKYCSAECRINNQKSKRSRNWDKEKAKRRTGKNNPAYRNGNYCRGKSKTHVGQDLFNKNKNDIKQSMIDDVGYVYCEHCKTSNSLRFESHHIIFRSEKPKHPNLHDKENIYILCIKHHNLFHKEKSIRNELVLKRGLDKIFGNDVLLNRKNN